MWQPSIRGNKLMFMLPMLSKRQLGILVGFVFFFEVLETSGKPEWKCEANEEEEKKQKNCCVDPKSDEPSYNKPPHFAHTYKQPYTPASSNPAPRAYQNKGGFIQRMRDAASSAAETASLYARRIGRFLYGVGCKAARLLRTVAQYIWAFLKTFFTTSVPSKTLPATPKPFQPHAAPAESPSFNKVEFKPEDLAEAYEKEKLPMAHEPEVSYIQERQQLQEQAPPPMPAERQPPPVAMPRMYAAERPTYELDPAASIQAQRYTDTSLDGRDMSPNIEEMHVSQHHAPPAPPPPPPPTPFSKPIRIENTVNGREGVDQWESESSTARSAITDTLPTATVKREPPGLGKLPADVMAELHGEIGTQKMRQEREASVQREMTQSCHPDMAQWKSNDNDRYDRSATATPFRASSVGPTMRKLEQVVSRLEDSSDNEAQYVFRAKPSDYMMGKSVYTPIEEAEQMRDNINREKPAVQNPYVNYPRSLYETSRPVTPAHSVSGGRYTPFGHETYASAPYKNESDGVRRRARTVGPLGRESMHSFYANAPVASHTVRRTPVPFDRGANFAYDRDGVTQGTVSSQVRRWPPASNATGAEVSKDDWVREVAREQDDGLITTMARSKL
ncbi:hypothetical protein Y032_0004g1875 [Ancylostoma ceylanicum]|uniref:Uncharacterized protein n=2 Tax=Ancylostoma ceylanicum TaxID=53326 RepID=A0A016VVA9_9BILA|nr:hypothetical protein Y032_0004g1875 [Ancylostoma ceylanicum]